MQKYSPSWPAEAWAEAYGRALAYVFELPRARTVESAESQLVSHGALLGPNEVYCPVHSGNASAFSPGAFSIIQWTQRPTAFVGQFRMQCICQTQLLPGLEQRRHVLHLSAG